MTGTVMVVATHGDRMGLAPNPKFSLNVEADAVAQHTARPSGHLLFAHLRTLGKARLKRLARTGHGAQPASLLGFRGGAAGRGAVSVPGPGPLVV